MTSISKEEYANILSSFLKEIEFEMPSWRYDHSLEQPVMEYFRRQPWEPHLTEKAVKMARWASTGLGMCYPFVDKEGQIAIGIFATYVLFTDDLPQLADAFGEFSQRLITHEPQKSAVLQSFTDFLPTIGRFFGPYADAMIIKSTIEYVCGCFLEYQYNARHDENTILPVGAHNFPSYFRQKNGYAEPHAHFAFPQKLYPEEHALAKYLPIIPDLCDFINYANDVLSFYKESMIGTERLNFICNYATVHEISISDALRLTCSSAIQNVHRIRKVLSVEPDLLDTTNQFMCGYVAWYLNQERYELSNMEILDKNGAKIRGTENARS